MTTTSHATGRTVVITGAAGGVGAALVERFLGNGDRVIATDVSADALDALRSRLDAGDDLVTVAGSIADEQDVETLAAAARDGGGVDVLLNVAGFFPFDHFADTTPQRWRTVIDINLTGYFLVTHALLPLMRSRG
jgi:3-oxoacyl-[acyl-carrier protein] reductase